MPTSLTVERLGSPHSRASNEEYVHGDGLEEGTSRDIAASVLTGRTRSHKIQAQFKQIRTYPQVSTREVMGVKRWEESRDRGGGQCRQNGFQVEVNVT
ncbi:hypothetical protein BgiMline_010998 [Biomphalaria glabrata]